MGGVRGNEKIERRGLLGDMVPSDKNIIEYNKKSVKYKVIRTKTVRN